MEEQVQEFLAHWGVKGMKWGIRRSRASRLAASRRHTPDYAEVKKLSKKKAKHLTNEELKKINERRNLENNFENNRETVFKKIERGEKRIKTIHKFGLGVTAIYALKNTDMGRDLTAKMLKSGAKKVVVP